MRGKVAFSSLDSAFSRITPAYAGKRRISASLTGVRPGSPPRMRGKVPLIYVTREDYRITPAYAGKRGLGYADPIVIKDHPRVCGEKTKKIP